MASLYRRGNYPLLNYTHANYVDILLSTISYPTPYLDEIPLSTFHVGPIESLPTCFYVLNPDVINIDQPPCNEALFTCSHFYVYTVYISAVSGKCLYKFKPCPSNLTGSSGLIGLTRFNCKDHPFVRTCVNAAAFPLQKCF